MAPENTEKRTPLYSSQPEGVDEPVDETMLFPLPAPNFDEERDTAVGGPQYGEDFSRLGRAYRGRRSTQEIPIPHIGDVDGAGYRVPGEGRSRSRMRPLLALFLVSIMACIIFAAATYGLEMWGGTTIPNVCGISEARATALLNDAGFVVNTKSRIADDGIGFVMEQEPESGVRAEEGDTVTIIIATSRTMPEVSGLTQAEALDLLSKAGAENIEVVGADSNEEEGKVLSVKPAEGEPFSAHQTVTLTVAQKPLVPNIVGKDKVEAAALVEAAGFTTHIEYVNEDGNTNEVVRMWPDPDSKADPGSEVWLYVVEPMPADPLHLLEYFGKSSPSIARYVENKGFYLYSSFTSSEDEAEAVYYSDSYGYLCFCNRPYSHAYVYQRDEGVDVMGDGHPFVGIRWEVPKELLPTDASKLGESAVRDIMTRCGLSSISDVCTNSDIQMPKDVSKTKAKFRCAYGEVGSNCWTILVVNEGDDSTRAVVTCAPISYYQSNYDLEPYGKSICDFVACMDVYTEL